MKVLVLQHVACEGLGALEKSFNLLGVGVEYLPLFESSRVPSSLDEYGGIVVLGGPMNVYQEKEYPFLVQEDWLIKKALSEKKPMLGICLGAQLIAKAAGAKVSSGHRKEIGWFNLKLTSEGRDDFLFKGLPKEFTVFQWHGDTFETPIGAAKLASSEIFPNQAFRLGNAYGLQFHLEMREEDVYDWLKEYEQELASLDYIDADRIKKETKKNIGKLYKHADMFARNFIKML